MIDKTKHDVVSEGMSEIYIITEKLLIKKYKEVVPSHSLENSLKP